MIRRTEYANVNLVGDGKETSVSLNLQDEVKGTIKSVVSVTLRGPNPLPDVEGKVTDGLVILTFTEPLVDFIGNNGYTAFITLEVE